MTSTRCKRLPLIALIRQKFVVRLQHLPKGQRRMIVEQYALAVAEAGLQWAQELREYKTGVKEVLRDSEYVKDNWLGK